MVLASACLWVNRVWRDHVLREWDSLSVSLPNTCREQVYRFPGLHPSSYLPSEPEVRRGVEQESLLLVSHLGDVQSANTYSNGSQRQSLLKTELQQRNHGLITYICINVWGWREHVCVHLCMCIGCGVKHSARIWFNPKYPLWGRFSGPHFTGEEIATQRGEVTDKQPYSWRLVGVCVSAKGDLTSLQSHFALLPICELEFSWDRFSLTFNNSLTPTWHPWRLGFWGSESLSHHHHPSHKALFQGGFVGVGTPGWDSCYGLAWTWAEGTEVGGRWLDLA
jgi:hypothetical protein